MTVFFDLDKTLLDVNSGSEWLRHEFKAGRVTLWQTVQAVVWLMLYYFFGADMTKPLQLAMESLAGTEEAEIVARSDAFYQSHMTGHLRPGARKALDFHRAGGPQRRRFSCSIRCQGDPAHLSGDLFTRCAAQCNARPVIGGQRSGLAAVQHADNL